MKGGRGDLWSLKHKTCATSSLNLKSNVNHSPPLPSQSQINRYITRDKFTPDLRDEVTMTFKEHGLRVNVEAIEMMVLPFVYIILFSLFIDWLDENEIKIYFPCSVIHVVQIEMWIVQKYWRQEGFLRGHSVAWVVFIATASFYLWYTEGQSSHESCLVVLGLWILAYWVRNRRAHGSGTNTTLTHPHKFTHT